MRKSKIKIFKIIIFLVALIIIGGVLSITNAFAGNPISSFRAKKTIEKYVEENYKDRDFEVGKVKYSFKDAIYFSNIESESSIDTTFPVYYRNGEIYRDDYGTYVSGKFNTSMRLSKEFSDIIEKFILEEVGYKNKVSINNKSISGLKLDMELNESLFINEKIILTLYLEDLSEEEITKVLTTIHNKLMKKGYVLSEYTLFVEGKEDAFIISGIKSEDIENGKLLNIIKDNGFRKTKSEK